MYVKRLVTFLLFGAVVCLGASVQATETPAATNSKDTAATTQPSVTPAPTPKPQTTPPGVSAQPTEKVDDTAPQAFVPQKHFTFPSTMDGSRVLHDFIVQNKGDAPLKITKVRTG